jgi:hypothetical protein
MGYKGFWVFFSSMRQEGGRIYKFTHNEEHNISERQRSQDFRATLPACHPLGVLPHAMNNSLSSASIDCTSGNRGVILHPYGRGRLSRTNQRSPEQQKRKEDCSLQDHPSIYERLCVQTHFLPTFITNAFQVRSPERRGDRDEE